MAPRAFGFCVPAAGVFTAAGESLEPPVLVMLGKVGMPCQQIFNKDPALGADAPYSLQIARAPSAAALFCSVALGGRGVALSGLSCLEPASGDR